jgi:hypothetical protein
MVQRFPVGQRINISGEVTITSGSYLASGLYVVTDGNVTILSGSNLIGKIIQTDGTTDATLFDIKNLNATTILNDILKELKKINIQLSLLTDEEIEHTEVK